MSAALTSRRSLLSRLAGTTIAFPAAVALVPTPAVAETITETPIKRLARDYFRALREHHRILDGVPAGQWVHVGRLSPARERMHRACAAIEREPINTLEDAGLKVLVSVNIGSEHHALREEVFVVLDRELA